MYKSSYSTAIINVQFTFWPNLIKIANQYFQLHDKFSHTRNGNLSHVMTLWYFSSSINLILKHACVAISGVRCLIFGRTLCLLPYFMCANSESSGETERMGRFAWAFAGLLCDKYHNLMSCLIYRPNHCGRHHGKINGLNSTYVKVWRCTFGRITQVLMGKS